MLHARNPARGLLAFAVVLAATGCRCGGGTTDRTLGEIGVIWRNEVGERIVNRDAVYDFGPGLIGATTRLTMTVRNVGGGRLTLARLERTDGDDVSIGDVAVAGAPFTVKFKQTELQPAEQAEFEMTFSPQALKAGFETKLALTGEGVRLEDAVAVITLRARGEKGACDLPDRIDFGNVPVGETLSYTLEYRNPTSVPASGLAGPLAGADATSFGYDATTPGGTIDVPPMTNKGVRLTFSPTEKRAYEATVTVRGAGACGEKTIPVTGAGSDDILSWTPNMLAFGFVSPGADAVKEVVFTNPSNVPITLTQVGSSMPTDFSQYVQAGVDATTFTVPGGGVPTAMKVACSPSGLGPRTATFTFQTGLRRIPSGSIALTCTGGGPRIKVAPRPTIGFGRVGFFPGNTSFKVDRRVTIQNVGSRPPMPDLTANLFLGQVVNGMVGQGTPFELTPGAGTDASEFAVTLASTYDGATGIEAIAGRNFVDFLITLTPQSVGMKSATLTFYSNDNAEPEVTLTLTADVQQLPPCNYAVTPAMVDFGLVTPGQSKDLPVTITNRGTGSDVCYLTGIDLAAGTSPAYSIVGGPIVEKELQPQQSFDVVVRVTPPGPVPATIQTLVGTLRFNATSPANPQANVPLRASIGPSCLAVTPDPQDFGTTKIGCNSAARTFNVYNVCSTPVQINSVTLQAAGGQPPGGANCSGPAACPEFVLISTPSGSVTLNSASAPLQFQARYRPIDTGSDSGAVALSVIQQGQTVTYLVGLLGKGDTLGQQTDTFVQDQNPKADILLVVDDSCSMEDKQTSLAQNFASFIQYAASANVDYQIGVTTTSVSNEPVCVPVFGCSGSKSGAGILFRDPANGVPPILTSRTPNAAQVFSKMVDMGTNGDGEEKPLETATMALTPPRIVNENAGFLRADANLAVVVVSDAGDQSVQSVSYYQNRLINVKGFNRLSMFTFNVIGPFLASAPGACTYDGGGDPNRYTPIITYTSGVRDEICTTNWAAALQGLGRTAFGFRTQFFLNNSPDRTPGKLLEVKVDGQISPPSNWTYDAAANAIRFNTAATPGPGQTLSVTYDTACFP